MTVFTNWFPQAFLKHANFLVVRYGAPVWLVGGALENKHIRDIDIRVELTQDQFFRLYGGYERGARDFEEWEWNWGYDCLKQSIHLNCWGGAPVDFQTQLISNGYSGKPKLRLDTAPDWIFEKTKGGLWL